MTHPAPFITIAVIHRNLRGYPVDCLNALGASNPSPDMEYLLLTDDLSSAGASFPGLRVFILDRGDRATAKNLALKEAQGEFILFVSADVVPRPNAIRLLREFIESSPVPVVASAQLLTENGMRAKTRYVFPSLLREMNPFAWLGRVKRRIWRKGRPPGTSGTVAADALRTLFLMGRRETFEDVGPFVEGFRFDHEDIEWCQRAHDKGVSRRIVTAAHAFKISPQLYGLVPPEVCLAMAHSRWRLVAKTHGLAYVVAYVTLTRAKSFCKWIIAGLLNRVLFGCSILIAQKAAAHGAIWRVSRYSTPCADLPPDVESHVRWEAEL